MHVDPRATYAAEQLADVIRHDTPGAAGFEPLAAGWLPSRSADDEETAPDEGLVFLVLLGSPHEPAARNDLQAPYLVAVANHDVAQAQGRQTLHRADLIAVEEVATYDAALAVFAARLTGIAVEALTDGTR